jgi:hypothetical protein
MKTKKEPKVTCSIDNGVVTFAVPSTTTAATVSWLRECHEPCNVVDHDGNRMPDLVDLILNHKPGGQNHEP